MILGLRVSALIVLTGCVVEAGLCSAQSRSASHIEQGAEVMAKWKAWMGKVGSALTDVGSPFGPGSSLIDDGSRILTHCNAGALAFIDFGTALSPIRLAHSRGMRLFVFIDETRPRCQGSRLTAWELQQEEIPYAVIVDNAAGYFLRKGEIDMIIVGADRIASASRSGRAARIGSEAR